MRQAFSICPRASGRARNALLPRAAVEKNSCMPDQSDSLRRLKTVNTLMAIVILVLLGQAAWQAMQVSSLRAELDQSQNALETRAASLAAERIKFRREEMVAVVQWLDEFYASPEGLQRPGGLVNASTNRPDAEALGVWVMDVYLQARIAGASEEEARQRVADNIRGTDEWRRKHPK
jgi:hypothetical protein